MLLVDAVAAAAGIGVSGTKGSKLVLAARAGALEKAVAKLISFFTGCKAERSSACTCTCTVRVEAEPLKITTEKGEEIGTEQI